MWSKTSFYIGVKKIKYEKYVQIVLCNKGNMQFSINGLIDVELLKLWYVFIKISKKLITVMRI